MEQGVRNVGVCEINANISQIEASYHQLKLCFAEFDKNIILYLLRSTRLTPVFCVSIF